MAQTRPLSPAARAKRHPKALFWGVLLLIVWVVGTLLLLALMYTTGERGPAVFAATQVFMGWFFVLGLIFLIIGIKGLVDCHRFNVRDWALANSIADSMNQLWHVPQDEAYRTDEQMPVVQNARLIEIERHFDQQTEGAIAGTMEHQLKMFGTSFSASYGRSRATGPNTSSGSSTSVGSFSGSIKGLSQVNLGLSSTTRNNLMGDALFSVFEAAGPAGERDTYRVISMSRPGVQSWINDLVGFAAFQVGGPSTHAGTTMQQWAGRLIAQFAPGDISYVTDRLKALQARPFEEREPVRIVGTFAGRNAVIATHLQIGAGQELRLLPSRFPQLFGQAVAEAITGGEQRLVGQAPDRASIQR